MCAFGVAWFPNNLIHSPDTTVFEAATDAYGINQGIQLFEHIVVVIVNKFGMSALLFCRLVATWCDKLVWISPFQLRKNSVAQRVFNRLPKKEAQNVAKEQTNLLY